MLIGSTQFDLVQLTEQVTYQLTFTWFDTFQCVRIINGYKRLDLLDGLNCLKMKRAEADRAFFGPGLADGWQRLLCSSRVCDGCPRQIKRLEKLCY